MKNAVKSYRRAVRRRLRCSPTQKRQLTKALDQMLRPLLEESPAPDAGTLHDALGAPETVAAELLADIPAEEQKRWKYIRRGVVAACVVVVVALLTFLIYEAAIRPIQMTIVEEAAETATPVEISE